jgi:type IV pilus assembly protein PilP
MKRGALIVVFLAFALSLGVYAQERMPAKPRTPEKPAAAMEEKKPVKEAEKNIEEVIYTYDPIGRRDPFLSIIKTIKAAEDEEGKLKPPIEKFSVEQFKLIAVVLKGDEYYGLVKLPDNKHYILKAGMTLGIHKGIVAAIGPDSMTVRETIKDFRGRPQSKDIILRLREEEGQ